MRKPPASMQKRKFHLLSHLIETSPALFTILTFTGHVLLAPYIKVEESFNLHAVHDVFAWGLSREAVTKFDHNTFEQPVYRSFLPSLVLATLSWPLCVIGRALGLVRTTLDVQICVRLALAWTTALSLLILAKSIRRRTGSLIERNAFLLLSITQFHVPFWGSRTIPNSLASPVVCYALSLLIQPNASKLLDPHRAIIILTATTTIVRSELASLLLPLTLVLIYQRRLTLVSAVTSGAIGGFGGLAATLLVDRWFYGVWVWSEMQAAVFNVVEGQSADWGVMSKHYYFTNSLPKLLLFTATLLLYALIDPNARAKTSGLKVLLLVPATGMLGIMSCVGHKEWRFIVYVVPCFNVVAAMGAGHIWRTRHQRTFLAKFRLLILVGGLLANIAVMGLLTWISRNNYPGGKALEYVHKTEAARAMETGRREKHVRVFLSPAATTQGASLFTFQATSVASDLLSGFDILPSALYESSNTASPPKPYFVEYNRTESLESLSPQELWLEGFSYVITDQSDLWDQACAEPIATRRWQVGEVEYVPRGVDRGRPIPRPRWEKALTVYTRVDGDLC